MPALNLYVVWRERVALDWHSGAWITVGRFVGTFGGLAVLVTMAMQVFRPGRGVFVAAGSITGVTETVAGIGGPPLALVYQHHPVAVMRSTIALCFVVGELISLAFLWQAGRVDALQLAHAAQLLPALLVGAALSQLVHHRMNAGVLRTFVMLFSIASGLVLIVRARAHAGQAPAADAIREPLTTQARSARQRRSVPLRHALPDAPRGRRRISPHGGAATPRTKPIRPQSRSPRPWQGWRARPSRARSGRGNCG